MIRIERTAELDVVRELDRIVFPGDDPPDVESAEWWLAWSGDEPIAFAGARILSREPAVMLERCGVLREARGRGIQLRLIRARLRWAGARGVGTAITYTHPQSVASSNNLIRAGFFLYQPEHAWVGADFLYWRRAA